MADNSNETKSSNPSRRNFLKIGAGFAGAVVVSATGIPSYGSAAGENSESSVISSLQSQLSSTRSQLGSAKSALSTAHDTVSSLNTRLTATQNSLDSANSRLSTLQAQVSTTTGFLALTTPQQKLVEALAEAIIPSDSSGPGAKEAGAIYFIDRQLATDYGNTANMYMQGPFVSPNLKQPVTVDGITYSAGTPTLGLDSHHYYQHPVSLRQFWNSGLQFLEDYCNQAYGGNFENLSASDQANVLTDLWNNKPTNFTGITPQEFYAELQSLVWAGFFTDPLYGGNQGMVGWELIGFPGLNLGDFYGEGYTMIELITASTPTKLKPVSIAQLQQASTG